MKRKVSMALLAALVTLALLAGAALAAARSGIFESLFGDSNPSERAEQLRVADGVSVEQDGLRITLDESLYDGNRLFLTWTVEWMGDDPVLFSMTSFLLDGMRLYVGYDEGIPLDYMRLQQLGGSIGGREMPKKRTYSTDFGLEAVEGGIQDAHVQLTALACIWTSVNPPELFDMTEAEDWEAVYRNYFARRVIAVDTDDVANMTAYPEISEKVMQLPENSTYADYEKLYEDLGFARSVAAIPVSFQLTLAPPENRAHTAPLKTEFEFPDYTLKVTCADFAAATTEVSFIVEPKEALPDLMGDLSPETAWAPFWRSYDMLDEAGNKLVSPKGYMNSEHFTAISEDGEKAVGYNIWGPPFYEIPGAIVLTPVSEEGEYLMEEAVVVPIGKVE